MLRLAVAVTPGGPPKPHKRRWAPVMPREGGGVVGHYWNAVTKAWFEVNPQMFLPFQYAEMDFRGDPEMGLPPGYAWGPAGMFLCFKHLFEYICFYVF